MKSRVHEKKKKKSKGDCGKFEEDGRTAGEVRGRQNRRVDKEWREK